MMFFIFIHRFTFFSFFFLLLYPSPFPSPSPFLHHQQQHHQQEYAEKNGIHFFETSAKNTTNVNQAFLALTSEIRNKFVVVVVVVVIVVGVWLLG